MNRKFTAILIREDDWYVAHCREYDVVSQGRTVEEAKLNIAEAVACYLKSFADGEVPPRSDECLILECEATAIA